MRSPVTTSVPPEDHDDDFWRDYLTKPAASDRRRRRIFSRLPRAPRCRLCGAPFAGPAVPVMRLAGRRPAWHNPSVCERCFTFISAHHGGAEIECTMLFADIRGSTTIAEGAAPSTFYELLERFYAVAATAVFRHDGTIDKFVGDEVVAIFLPLLCGDRHAALAVDAARELLASTGHGSGAGPWVQVGAGVNTGTAWYGTVGQGWQVDVTALGDAMNVTARLAAVARAGEVLVAASTAEAAGLRAVERRTLSLTGRKQSTDVVVVTASPGAS